MPEPRESSAASVREQALEQALRDLMDALVIDAAGDMTTPFKEWAEPWCRALEVLDAR